MTWWQRTHGPTFELTRHFLARTFDSEMFPARGQWATVAVSAFALLLPAGMVLLMIPEKEGMAPAARELTLLIRVLAIMAVMTLAMVHSLFPSKRDYLSLAGLPVRSRQIFFAKFLATLVLALGAALALAVPLGVGSVRTLLLGCGCLFIFFAIAGVEGLVLNLAPPRWYSRAAGLVQALMMAGALGAGAATWTVWRAPAWMPRVGLLGGGAVAAMLFTGLMYAVAAMRYRALLVDAADAAPRRAGGWRVLNLLAPDGAPRRQAVLHFLAAVLGRSRVHRMVVAGYLAAGLGLMVNTLLVVRAASGGSVMQAVALYWPLGLSIVALAGVRHAFLLPAELPANWIFRITETQGRRQWMQAVERFLIACVILPIHAGVFGLAALSIGVGAAARTGVLELVLSLAAFELIFQNWQQLPFTCSYVPGKNSLIELLAGWMVVLLIVVPVLGTLIGLAAASAMWWLPAMGVSAAGWWWAHRQRREGWGEAHLIYEDAHLEMADLGIREAARGAGFRAPEPFEAYRTLARALPQEFRDNYGDDLLQAAAEAARSKWDRRRLLLDLGVRIPVEHLADLAKDLRYGVRALAASPGFTAAALASLSLGICIATCAISEMNGIALREVPAVARPSELMATSLPVSYPLYRRFREQPALFSGTMAYLAPVVFDVTVGRSTERAWGHLVTPSYFATLGIRPAMGRFFDPSYDSPGGPPLVVVSDRFWCDHLAGDPGIVGRTLRVNGRAATVTGIAPPDFAGASPLFFTADIYLPLTSDAALAPELAGRPLERGDAAMLRFVARLRPEVSPAQAESALDAIARQFDRDQGIATDPARARRIQVVDGGKVFALRKQDLPLFSSFLLVLAGLVMLIACSSVANMMLARAASRRREIAIRLAMGASRSRIVRQLVAESMLIATAAGTLGFLACALLMHAMSQVRLPFPMPVNYNFAPDPRVFLMTLVLTVATGLAFGLAPALQATRVDLTGALKEGGNVRLGRHRHLSLRNLLIVAQVAGSLTLLVMLGVTSLGIQSTLGIQAGFDPDRLYLLSLDPVRDGYSQAQAAAFFGKLLDRVQAMPSVTAAALTESVPVAMAESVIVARPGASRVLGHAVKHLTGKDYFATTGIPIVAGRAFRREDETGETAAAIVSAAMAREFFGGEDALGRRLEIGTGEPIPARTMPGTFDYRAGASGKALRVVEIVGVAGDVAEGLIVQKPRPAIYFPLREIDFAHPGLEGVTLILRATPGVDALARARREIAAMDPNVNPFHGRSMREHIEEFMGMLRVASWTYAVVGLFGYVLAGVGLAGVTAYAVQQRRREIGIRMALGAQRGNVLGVVMKESAVLVMAGAVLGLVGAWAGTRFLAALNGTAGQVTSLKADDPSVMIGSTALVGVLALVACYLPARRSTKIDPAIVLRQE